MLRAAWPEVTVVASADCGNLRPGLYLTAIPASDARAAQFMVTQLRSQVKDAYVRECRAKPDSRVQLGLPLIDPSIAGVPANTVNWTDADRVSTVHKLAGGGYLWVRRRYQASPEDPREGRREAVWFFEASPASARQMESDCTDPSFARVGARLALSCARETAAEHLLHTTFVYRIGVSVPTQSIRRCRSPRFTSETELTCQEETISGAGELRLTRKRVALTVSP